MILKLRDAYKPTPEYKRVYNKNSFDDWMGAIKTLMAWDVFDNSIEGLYKRLAELRNSSIHFRPDLDNDPRPLALDAIRLLGQVIDAQFGTVMSHRWCVMGQGEVYVRGELEELHPFFWLSVLASCSEGRPTTPAGDVGIWLAGTRSHITIHLSISSGPNEDFLDARSAALVEGIL